MLIKEDALKHWIDNFYGYGSWDARIWFIDYEDGGGDTPEEVAEKLDYFYKSYPKSNVLCDIRDLYKHVAFRVNGPKAALFSNLNEYRFGKNAMLHGVWKNLIGFVSGYKGENLPDLLAYQKKSFVSMTAPREALIQLYPLPSPHNHAWYYSWLELQQLNFLKSRPLYEEHLFAIRMNTILHNINIYKPEVVVMYGMNSINELKKAVQELFSEAKFKLIKGNKLQTPQHHRADFNGTTMLITTQVPALRHNRIESGFNWEEFGRKVKSE